MERPAVDADMKDENVCRNSDDPAIIRRGVELVAQGKKVLLLTNDASVAIRSMGMCDDLQRTNGIDDETWDNVYAPIRPMVMTFDDLKILDAYTRQYHFLQSAAGKLWMEDVPQQMEKRTVAPLTLWVEGFRPGDRHSEKQGNRQKQGNGNDKKGRGNAGQKQKQNAQDQKKDTVKQQQNKPEPVKEQVDTKKVEAVAEATVQEETPQAAEEQQEKKPKHRGGRRGGRKPKAQTPAPETLEKQ